MSRTPCRLVALFALIASLPLFCPAAEEADGSKLPGALPAVDAADHPSLQAAIDALPEHGGIVRIPAGEFEITEPLHVRGGDVTLAGVGGATHIRNANTEAEPAIVIGSGQPHPRRRNQQDPIWRVTVRDLRLTGNEDSGHGIVGHNVNELFLHAVTVTEHGGDGVRLDYCYENPRVADCQITYNKKTGLHLLGCHDIVVSANQFEENHDGVRCVEGFNLTMTGNNLDDHLGHGVVLERMMGSTVSANMIEQCQGYGIVIERDTYGINLAANVLTNDTAGGIHLRDAHGCTVSANTFSTVPRNALRIGPDSDRITVTGNTFTNAYLGDGEIRTRAAEGGTGAGIVLERTQHITITGNTFSQVTPKALILEGDPSRHVIFMSNTLIESESDHERLEDSMVKDNITSE